MCHVRISRNVTVFIDIGIIWQLFAAFLSLTNSTVSVHSGCGVKDYWVLVGWNAIGQRVSTSDVCFAAERHNTLRPTIFHDDCEAILGHYPTTKDIKEIVVGAVVNTEGINTLLLGVSNNFREVIGGDEWR